MFLMGYILFALKRLKDLNGTNSFLSHNIKISTNMYLVPFFSETKKNEVLIHTFSAYQI